VTISGSCTHSGARFSYLRAISKHILLFACLIARMRQIMYVSICLRNREQWSSMQVVGDCRQVCWTGNECSTIQEEGLQMSAKRENRTSNFAKKDVGRKGRVNSCFTFKRERRSHLATSSVESSPSSSEPDSGPHLALEGEPGSGDRPNECLVPHAFENPSRASCTTVVHRWRVTCIISRLATNGFAGPLSLLGLFWRG
jgi:hypothetical protein